MESEQQGHPAVDPSPDPDVPTPAGQTPASDTTAPVPDGEKPVEDDPNFEQTQQEEDAADPEDVPDTSGLEEGLESPSQVPPDGDNSQAELKEAPSE